MLSSILTTSINSGSFSLPKAWIAILARSSRGTLNSMRNFCKPKSMTNLYKFLISTVVSIKKHTNLLINDAKRRTSLSTEPVDDLRRCTSAVANALLSCSEANSDCNSTVAARVRQDVIP